MSGREFRRRSRSRSLSPRRDRSRDRDRGDKHRHKDNYRQSSDRNFERGYEKDYRENDRYNRRERSRSNSRDTRKRIEVDEFGRIKEADDNKYSRGKETVTNKLIDLHQTKLNSDQLKKERLALVKSLTANNEPSSNLNDDGVNDENDAEDEEEDMAALLGFSSFGSTKGTAVEDNQLTAASGAVSKNKARKYRQYMNRKGGFNRPLQKMD